MSPPEHCGFTRLELLGLVAALFLLMGLLLPNNFNWSHHAARLNQCMNNQRQIADAMTLFAKAHGFMPAAMSSPVDPATGKQVPVPFGWAQGLLPELQLSDLVPNSYTMTTADAPFFPLLVCAEDGNRFGNGAHDGPLSYVVNGGGFKNWNPKIGVPFDSPANGAWSFPSETTSHPGPTTSLEFIAKHKGLAQTISHSENLDARSYILSSPRADYEDEILWDPSAPLRFNQDAGNGKLDNAHARPSSNHGGGALVTFCDGHVSFINDSISYSVYATLMVSDPAAATAPPGFLVWPLNPSQIPVK